MAGIRMGLSPGCEPVITNIIMEWVKMGKFSLLAGQSAF